LYQLSANNDITNNIFIENNETNKITHSPSASRLPVRYAATTVTRTC